MKTAAIIAEYNPFHNGHLYQLNKIKEITDSDFIISIMSGNFMQRGVPALLDKYSRGLMAISSGIDLAIELPLPYACGSAGDFAEGAVRLINELGVADYLCFGAECDNLELLMKIAEIITSEPADYKNILRDAMKSGHSYPAARNKAIISCCPEIPADELTDILTSPNNILAIEYLSALIKTNAKLKPIIIRRTAADYHDTSISGNICSANAIRSLLADRQREMSQKDLDIIKAAMPSASYNMISEAYRQNRIIFPDDMMSILRYRLTEWNSYSLPYDMDENLANRIKNTDMRCSLNDFIGSIKAKNYTYSKISRALLHLILDISTDDMLEFKDNGFIYYGNILGFRKSATGLIKAINHNSSIPLINKKATWNNFTEKCAKAMAEKELLASNIYNNLVYEKSGIRLPGEFITTTPFI